MRIIVWNMHAPFEEPARHKLAWDYLRRQDFDVALLQETCDPETFMDAVSSVWHPKYETEGRKRIRWGTAVVSPKIELEEPDPDEDLPWLSELRGSVAVARTSGEPKWLASIHAFTEPIPEDRLRAHPVDQIPVSTPDGSLWETDLIPFELRKLFGDDTFGEGT